LSCHCAIAPSRTTKTKTEHKQKKKHKNTNHKNHNQKRNQRTTKKQHGDDQLVSSLKVKRIGKDDISPMDRYGKHRKRKHKPRNSHTAICEHEKQHSTVRKPRLPPARSLEITKCEPRQRSHRLPILDTIQKPAMTLPCGTWKVRLKR